MPFKHTAWIQKELETVEKEGMIFWSVFPWASLIVAILKWIQLGEPPRRSLCEDYRALNNLIPPVTKAHSKPKVTLTLVPLPKIADIYAQLTDSKCIPPKI